MMGAAAAAPSTAALSVCAVELLGAALLLLAVTLHPWLPRCLAPRSFANAHTYHINSIALSSDCETFISADDLRVNLWHLDRCCGDGVAAVELGLVAAVVAWLTAQPARASPAVRDQRE